MNSIKVWSLKKLSENIRKRQENKFDVNIIVSGGTGSGKSTFVGKLLFRFDDFDPWKHQVYKREDVIRLIQDQTLGICWDDEAINSSYKRQFQSGEQHTLIKTVAMYRSNFNLFISVAPEFYSIDKGLRDYYAIHIFVPRRGLAVVLRRDNKSIFATDRWYTTYNQKLEESWFKKKQKNPDFEIPYHKLKGFIAYVKFNDLTDRQRKIIEEVKKVKRAEAMKEEKSEKEIYFIDKIFNKLIEGKLTDEGLRQMCIVEDKKFSSVRITLNRMLKDKGEVNTMKYFLSLANNREDIINENKKRIEMDKFKDILNSH